MDNNLQVFQSNEFGQIRTLNINEEPHFVGKDIAECLAYNEPHKAVTRHVDKEDRMKHPILTNGGIQDTWIINESGLYSLILSSKLPTAKKFKRWVTSEVLPTIRKQGYYTSPNYTPKATSVGEVVNLMKELKSSMKDQGHSSNEIAQMQMQICKQFNINIPDSFLKPVKKYTSDDFISDMINYAFSNNEDKTYQGFLKHQKTMLTISKEIFY